MNAFITYVTDNFSQEERLKINSCGCKSWISGISEYTQTNKLFKKYGDEILEIHENYRENCSKPLPIDISSVDNMHRSLVWAAIEVVVDDICAAEEHFAEYDNLDDDDDGRDNT